MSQVNSEIGLFPVHYLVQPKVDGKPLLGAPVLNLNLLVNAPAGTICGVAHVFQAISPPLNVFSNVHGTWSYMATMSSTHILLVAEGQGPTEIIIHGQPQLVENLRLRASLEKDWQSGVCNYEFLYEGQWHKVEGASVSIEEFDQNTVLDKLQTAIEA
ncbi:DUF1842 domain-containing protein [Endozoicomonas sp. SM1973]|uniref:DUF1842 domain-containing protein n=1 Tax=Spartinivicinus marinus TaxID=2994442 RepID=A0A853ICP8_9GAMM|nr:DUF1842 domain-containing protein [Spartinivicinus marinus]MCX4029654.1 DUF1842 domain-containing protein [Spartinivicinus marinus]NYZ66965.1 DUF1842 domain-containing protein [Spartinivicinus marinus]